MRQGLNGHPLLGDLALDPSKGGDGFARVAVARVDANTGKLVSFTNNASQEGAP